MSKRISSTRQALIRDINLTSLGWELALPIFGGALIGYLIDRQTNMHYVFIIGFILLGIGIGYYNIYKYAEIELLRLKKSKKNDPSEDHSC